MHELKEAANESRCSSEILFQEFLNSKVDNFYEFIVKNLKT